MKKLVFKKGVNSIHFPIYKPLIEDFMFEEFAELAIEKIRSEYHPRDDVRWDVIVTYQSMYCEVVCMKKK